MDRMFELPESKDEYKVTYVLGTDGYVTVNIHRAPDSVSHFTVWDVPLTDEQWLAWMYYAVTKTSPRVGITVLESEFYNAVIKPQQPQTAQGDNHV